MIITDSRCRITHNAHVRLSTDSPTCPAQEAHTVLAHQGEEEEDGDEGDGRTAPVSVPVVVLVTLVIIVLIIIIYFQVRAVLFIDCYQLLVVKESIGLFPVVLLYIFSILLLLVYQTKR